MDAWKRPGGGGIPGPPHRFRADGVGDAMDLMDYVGYFVLIAMLGAGWIFFAGGDDK